MSFDNILIGEPVDGLTLEDLGCLPDEVTIRLTVDEVKNDKGEIFLPTILKNQGIFKSSNAIKESSKQREESTKIPDVNSRILWRNISGPEFTHFKIGKSSFWLIVGEI